MKFVKLAEGGMVRTRRQERADINDDGLLDSINNLEAGSDGWSNSSRFLINDAEQDDGEGIDVVGITLDGYSKKPTTVAGKMDDVSLKYKEEVDDANTIAMQKRPNL